MVPPQAAAPSAPEAPGRLLIVDDEEPLRRAFARVLEAEGHTVVQAADGMLAVHAVMEQRFDAILADIRMPGMTGIQLLRRVSEHDPDVPVVLITGNPSIDTAAQAVEMGALKYLIKPVAAPDLIATVAQATRAGRILRLRRSLAASAGDTARSAIDRTGMNESLDRAVAAMWMAYQPIVKWGTKVVTAYEALLRADNAELAMPDALFDAARRLGRIEELSRAIRGRIARDLREHPREGDLFVNLHPADLLDDELYSPDSALAPYAEQIVLEITERESLVDSSNVPARVARLRRLGYRIAIDDLGSGYSSLDYFARLTPEVAKIDMSLVRNIQTDEIKQKVVGSLITLCEELGVTVVAEGVETAAERDMLTDLGCDSFQGNLFARPAKPYPGVTW
jgi:EAL domain-containing protein (putative c-di-GMP-specific phosphodiesterase class I)/CheY-like chemotaxis protein